MPTTPITKTAVPFDNVGIDLTAGAEFVSIPIGAGEGVEFDHGPRDILIIRDDTAAGTTCTAKTRASTAGTPYGVTQGDSTLTIPTSTMMVYRMSDIFKQTTTGNVIIEATGAASIIVVQGN